MGGGKGGSVQPPVATPAPTVDDSAAAADAQTATDVNARSKGLQQTLLTSGAGAGASLDPANTKQKTLLGGGG